MRPFPFPRGTPCASEVVIISPPGSLHGDARCERGKAVASATAFLLAASSYGSGRFPTLLIGPTDRAALARYHARSVKRRRFNLAAAVSLLLCLATAALWVRNYRVALARSPWPGSLKNSRNKWHRFGEQTKAGIILRNARG